MYVIIYKYRFSYFLEVDFLEVGLHEMNVVNALLENVASEIGGIVERLFMDNRMYLVE